MPDASFQEYSDNQEGNKESIRSLVSSVARSQLEALGYKDTLAKFQEWFKGNPTAGFRFSKGISDSFIEEFRSGLLEVYLDEIKRIPDKDQARKLVNAALFGIPFSEGETGEVVIISYDIAEPNNRTRLTNIDPNNPGNNVWESVPNVGPTKILAGKVANTGFVPAGLVPIDVIRKLSWGEKVFEGVKQDNPSVKMSITPFNTALHIEVRKTP